MGNMLVIIAVCIDLEIVTNIIRKKQVLSIVKEKTVVFRTKEILETPMHLLEFRIEMSSGGEKKMGLFKMIWS